MARERNTKKLGQRVDRTYLRKLYGIPKWRRILTLICAALGLGWLGLYALARNQTPYTAGTLTPSHAFLGKRCAVCHGEGAGIGKKVADQQCASCHDGPVHQASQTFVPACISCHVEHRGATRLVSASDEGCTTCHSNLKSKTGRLSVAASVSSFRKHPEFAAVTANRVDTGLRFNHKKHVGELSQKCGDCHVPADTSQGLAKPEAHSHLSSRALMSIPKYATTCMPCHALTVDDKLSDPAPHEKPEVVHAFVVDQLTKYIAAHPADLGTDGTPRTPAAWVQFKVAADEKKLVEETCARCHTLQARNGLAAATVTPTHVTGRLLSRATFDHAAHQELACNSCHPKAASSEAASEVLLPGIAVCQQCHGSGSAAAAANCSTCHVYHDWSKEKPIEGKFRIDQVSRLLSPSYPWLPQVR